MRKLLNAIPGILAVLCILGFVPWTLGIPGVSGTSFATGWTIGFYAIVLYIVVFIALSVIGFAAGRGWLPLPAAAIHNALWVSVIAFAIAQAIAWSLILQS